MSNGVHQGVLVPLSFCFVEAITKFGFFCTVWSAIFQPAQEYVAFCHTSEVFWHLEPSLFHLPFSCYHWIWTTVSGRLGIEGSVKQREDETKYCAWHQKGATMTWKAVNYETLNLATALVPESFELDDGVRCDPYMQDVLHIEDDEYRLLHEPNWALEGLQLSVSNKLRLSVRLAIVVVKKSVCHRLYRGFNCRPCCTFAQVSRLASNSWFPIWWRCTGTALVWTIWRFAASWDCLGWKRCHFAVCWGFWCLLVNQGYKVPGGTSCEREVTSEACLCVTADDRCSQEGFSPSVWYLAGTRTPQYWCRKCYTWVCDFPWVQPAGCWEDARVVNCKFQSSQVILCRVNRVM